MFLFLCWDSLVFFFPLVSCIFVIAHWNIFMMAPLKYFQIVLISLFSLCWHVLLFFSHSISDLPGSWYGPGTLDIMLWDIASYLSLLFYLAFLDNAAVGEGEGLPHYCQVGAEGHVTHSASIDTEGCTLLLLLIRCRNCTFLVVFHWLFSGWKALVVPSVPHVVSDDTRRRVVVLLLLSSGESPHSVLGLFGHHSGMMEESH